MIPVLLTKVKTFDKVTLDGIYVPPTHKGKTALIWLHGLTSRFYSGQILIKELSSSCRKNRIGYFKFNTRGHDIVVRGPKHPFGTAFEKFENCIFDIRAIINLAKRKGYRKIILAGHSTGANKALYYLYKTHDRAVKGLMLLGPTSDIAYDQMILGKKELRRRVNLAKQIKKKNSYTLLPPKFGIWSAQRYVSILNEGSNEDIFPYYNFKATWKELKSVRQPIVIIVGLRDEYLDRKPESLIDVFRKKAKLTKSFSGFIIKNAGHSFYKKEKELTKIIIRWIKKFEK